MEYVQYEFERMQIEHYRRRKYDSSGVLFWMYNDCWPASGWSMVDYYGYPKAGYYGAKRASKPVMISLEDRGGSARRMGRERYADGAAGRGPGASSYDSGGIRGIMGNGSRRSGERGRADSYDR
ncbi:hypothetical protein [Cohnella rhizosphaerae]|uniref:Glycoside hydrolase family 2 catalytic domain-containing protein n=1 Tax=Cohnella rhizosphaerae TaxID=1457232 RepID=A0A9X4KTT8_9BACL|nr:hypothetical protein [Cohnella rhizosphaerae]MDG0810648.1 hypothetical protein [Cohnella rhizosphaerae]